MDRTVEVTLVEEPAAGDGCYRTQIEDSADHILRLDPVVWDAWNRPGIVAVTVKAVVPDVSST